jgi:hypothetical protein
MSRLHFRTTKSYSSQVGRQPIKPSAKVSPPRAFAGPAKVTDREIQGYQFLKQQQEQAREEETDTRDQLLSGIATADISPTTFITTDIVPQSVESYGPTDPRANPAGSLVSAASGFLPPPPA